MHATFSNSKKQTQKQSKLKDSAVNHTIVILKNQAKIINLDNCNCLYN